MNPGKRVAIVQPNYIPWKGYFDIINQVDEFIIFDEVQYTPKDWRNRNQIKTQQGLLWLTIPVRVSHQQQRINETMAESNIWRKKHWKSVVVNYKKAPFFEEVASFLEPLYVNSKEVRLLQIDIDFLETICKYLNISTPLILSSSIPQTTAERLERIEEILIHRQTQVFLNGPKARSFMSEDAFVARRIQIEWMDYNGYPEYPQFFPPFEHGVSILDLLFHCGKQSTQFMKSF
jgi:hypothetical protein